MGWVRDLFLAAIRLLLIAVVAVVFWTLLNGRTLASSKFGVATVTTIFAALIALLLGIWSTPNEIWQRWPTEPVWLLIAILFVLGLLFFVWPNLPRSFAPRVVWLFHKVLRLSELVIAVITAGVLGLLLYVLVHSMQQVTIDIKPIEVPKELADRGFTSTVAARRLRDAIEHDVRSLESSAEPPRFQPEGPDVVIHEVWLQPEPSQRGLGTGSDFAASRMFPEK